MKKLIVLFTLLLALVLPAVPHAQALIACPGPWHLSCIGHGGIVCVDKHGHIRRWHGRIHKGWHCVAI